MLFPWPDWSPRLPPPEEDLLRFLDPSPLFGEPEEEEEADDKDAPGAVRFVYKGDSRCGNFARREDGRIWSVSGRTHVTE